jgi:hypothetical protein
LNWTWTNFPQNLQNFREQRQTTPPRNDDPNWNRAGFPNQQIQDQFRAITNPETYATTCRVMIATLTQELQEPDSMEGQDTTLTKKNRQSSRIQNHRHQTILPKTPRLSLDHLHSPQSENYTFIKTNKMWNKPIKATLDSEEEESEEDIQEKTTAEERTPMTHKCTRTQDNEPNTLDKCIRMHNIKMIRKYLTILCREIEQSHNKLFCIQRHDTSRLHPEWHLVQIDLDETNPQLAQHPGEYHAKYYIRNYQHSKQCTTHTCKCWPLIMRTTT